MIGILFLALAAAPQPRESVVVDIPLHVCTAAEDMEWRFLGEHQLGVQARAHGAWVGLTAATDGFHDWFPLDDYKTTICGHLARFGIFEPSLQKKGMQFLPEVPEHDWNIVLVPTLNSTFDERFQLALRLMDRGREGDRLSCFAWKGDKRGENPAFLPCLEAEVTPHHGLLQASTAGRWLTGRRGGETICVFGPWVGDGGHGFRPEIHPAERIWWREGPDVLKLLFVQDSSQRFGDRRQFQWKVGQGEPGAWRPWAGAGLEGDFRLAFEVARGVLEFKVNQLIDVNTRPVPETQATELDFALKEGDTALAQVIVRLGLGPRSDRYQPDLSKLDIDIRREDVCVRQDTRTVQGYLTIHDKTGYGYQEGEGFEAFEVTVPPAIHFAEAESGYLFNEDPDKEPLRPSVILTATEKEQYRVPRRSIQQILGALLRAASPPPNTDDQVQRMRTAAVDIDIRGTRRFELSARPHYRGPRSDRLEDAIDGKRFEDMRRLLISVGEMVPAKVVWDFDIWDATVGLQLPKTYAQPNCHRELVKDDKCTLELVPAAPADHVLRIRATATLQRADGEPIPAASAQLRLANHFIRASGRNDADRVLEWLGANRLGNDLLDRARPLDARSRPKPESRPTEGGRGYRREYYARMLRHGIYLAMNDTRVTIDELAQFVAMADAFVDPPEFKAVAAPAVK